MASTSSMMEKFESSNIQDMKDKIKNKELSKQQDEEEILK